MDSAVFILALVSALGCGIAAGVFFAFSTFVMRALGRLSPQQGIAAMQSINVAAINPWFMTVLFGTTAACAAVIASALANWGNPYAPYLLSGGATYLLGTVGLTMAYHVPRNDTLAAVDPTGAEAASHWASYRADWTAWNHARAAAALVAAALQIGAIQVS
jgi:uncharacterized membrane protein